MKKFDFNIQYYYSMTSVMTFDDLFALRIELSDDYLDESEIIRELKMIMMNNGFSNESQVNTYLVNFYNHFGFEILPEIIESVNISPPMPISSINNLINQTFMNVNGLNNLVLPPIMNPSYTVPINEMSDDEMNDDEVSDDETPPNVNDFLNIFNNIIQQTDNNMTNIENMEDVKVILKDDSTIKKIKLEDNLEEKCSVCLSKMKKDEDVWELKCKHTFHGDCIKVWLKEYNYKCPICRQETGKGEVEI